MDRQGRGAGCESRYLMELHVNDSDMKPERLEGTREDFTVTVKCGKYADFTNHYFIEENMEGFCRYPLYMLSQPL